MLLSWIDFVDLWPYGDRTLFVALLWIAHVGVGLPWDLIAFWTHYFPDGSLSQRLMKYKIQPEAVIPDRLWKEAINKWLVNKLISGPLIGFFLLWPLSQFLGIPIRADAPSVGTFIWQVIVCYVINDALFYWTHRMWHSSPYLYQHIHAYHHRFTAPVSIATEFAHPLEYWVSNIIPAFVGPFILRSHVLVFAAAFAFRMLVAVLGHLGYSLTKFIPFFESQVFNSARGHDWHHSHNKGMYVNGQFWRSFFILLLLKHGNALDIMITIYSTGISLLMLTLVSIFLEKLFCYRYGELALWDWLTGTNKVYLEWRKQNPIHPE